MLQFFQRVLRVFLLDARVFEAVGTDEDANLDAVIIVSAVALVSAIAAVISAVLFSAGFGLMNLGLGLSESLLGDFGFRLPLFNPVTAFFRTFVGTYVSWLLWALTTYWVGVFLFRGDSNFTEMLRILGFASAPRVLSGLGFLPGIGWLPSLVGWIWALLAGFVGIRQGLKLSTGRTIFTIVLSVIVIFAANQFVIDPLFARLF